MAESPENQLARLCDELRKDVAANADAVADPQTQQAVEVAVAVGVARLQGHDDAVPSSTRSERSILAKDLWLTADLVLRALRSVERD